MEKDDFFVRAERKNHAIRLVIPGSHPLFFSPLRGRISHYSWRSRKRLEDLLKSFDVSRGKFPFKVFLTLTFKDDIPVADAKVHLHRFHQVLNRRGIGFFWCMEFQKKGRIHFHMLLTRRIPFKLCGRLWGQGFVFLRKIGNESVIIRYLIKEVGKSNQKCCGEYLGRWWGVSRALNISQTLDYFNSEICRDICEEGIKHRFYFGDYEKKGLTFNGI